MEVRPTQKKLARRWCDWFMTEGRAATEIRARDVVDAGELAMGRDAGCLPPSSLLRTLGPPLDIVGPDGCRRLRGTTAGNSVSVVALALLQAQSPPDLNACSPNNPPGLSVGKGFVKTSFDNYTAVRLFFCYHENISDKMQQSPYQVLVRL